MAIQISLTPIQLYLGLIINGIFTGFGAAVSQWIFTHFKEKAANRLSQKEIS
ncbi:MAG: hypothetical protein AABY22_09535 [Nanoarchaeota archaeon]